MDVKAMQSLHHHIAKSASVFLLVLTCQVTNAAVGIIDLDTSEPASQLFELFYHNGTTVSKTDYAGFQSQQYPLTTAGEYLITDTLSLICQQSAGMSFTFNGQGLQTLRVELLDMDNRVIWSFLDDDLYSGTSATSGKVPYKKVKCDATTITADGELPALARLRFSAAGGKDTYKLHLHTVNLYSTPLPWDKCRIELASPVQSDGTNLLITWITLNGASAYNVIIDDAQRSVSQTIPVVTKKHATQQATIPLDGLGAFSYHIEAQLDGHTVKSDTWRHSLGSGIGDAIMSQPEVLPIPAGLRITNSSEGPVAVYSITGACIAQFHTEAAKAHELRLPAGIYVVKIQNRAIKAIVRH